LTYFVLELFFAVLDLFLELFLAVVYLVPVLTLSISGPEAGGSAAITEAGRKWFSNVTDVIQILLPYFRMFYRGENAWMHDRSIFS
jgi:hypothetical protein